MSEQGASSAAPLPAVFLPHGGGPWTIVDMGQGESYGPLETYLRALVSGLPTTPRAVVCVSAHWEAAKPTVMTAPAPGMLYDYGGFPPAAYEFVWPAPGSPEVAGLVSDHLQAAGVAVASDPARGFDHGAFVPLMLSDPAAGIPTFELSLVAGLDPREHLAIGRALASLRSQGVLIVGSGMSYHNLPAFRAAFRSEAARARVRDDSHRFDDWLAETMAAEPAARESRLVEWAASPAGRDAHPREEHLLPLMVVAGAAEEGTASSPFHGEILGAQVRAVHLT